MEPSLQGIRGKRVREAKTALPPPVLPLVLTYGVTIEIENRERPACVAEVIAVHYR